jgi:hypothetical protein
MKVCKIHAAIFVNEILNRLFNMNVILVFMLMINNFFKGGNIIKRFFTKRATLRRVFDERKVAYLGRK